MQIRTRKGDVLTLTFKREYLLFGVLFFFMGGGMAILAGELGQKWSVLTITGIIGMTGLLALFISKWQAATQQQRLGIVLAMGMGFYMLQAMIFIQLSQ